jgi:hypothetical protein
MELAKLVINKNEVSVLHLIKLQLEYDQSYLKPTSF